MIGVAIVSFNTRDLLRDCLTSLRHTTLPLCICVIDNDSRDGSAAMVQAEFPEVLLDARRDNPGFARSTNLALERLLAVGCEYLLLLNPDTVVHAGALEALAHFLDQHPRVGMVGPRLLNPDGSLQPAAFRFPTLSMTILDLFPPGEALPGRLYNSWWHGRYPQEQGEAPFAIDHPLGACILARRSVIEQIGLLDPGYFMYAEEVDWCMRARRAGWAIWQQPQARVTHYGGASTSQVRARMQIALYRSRLRFFRIHAPAWQLRLHQVIIRLGALRLLFEALRAHRQGHLSLAEWHERMRAASFLLVLEPPQE
ncbi:MAG: glycosyltransferase family 2 protein [Roseiflexaceae bacterium]